MQQYRFATKAAVLLCVALLSPVGKSFQAGPEEDAEVQSNSTAHVQSYHGKGAHDGTVLLVLTCPSRDVSRLSLLFLT